METVTVKPFEEITQEEFAAYVVVQRSGVVNMYDNRVQRFAGISKATHMGILTHYRALAEKFSDVPARRRTAKGELI
mgnify:CR=1 FL=1